MPGEVGRPPLQPGPAPGPGLTWGLQKMSGEFESLCVLLHQGKQVLFGGAKHLLLSGARDLVALKKSRYPSGRKKRSQIGLGSLHQYVI